MANAFQTFVSSLTKKPAAGTTLSSLNTGYSPIKPSTPAPVQSSANMSIAPNQSVAGKNNFTPSNSSATSVKGTVITPPPQATAVPVNTAQQKYVASLAGNTTATANPPAYDKVTGLLTDYGRSQGLKEVNASGSTSGGLNTSGTTSTTPTGTKTTAKADPYLDYLRSLFNPEQLKTSQANIEAINQRTADELKRTREREDEVRKNDIGQLATGQNYQLGENERLSNKSLADLAIAKGANVDIYNQMINAGKSVYEAETAQRKYDDDLAQQTFENTSGSNLPASAQEYEYAKKQGYTGTFQQYQTEDANRKAVQQGLSPAQINTTVNSIAGAFDNEPIVKEYNTVKTTLDALKNAGTSPTDDIQRIYAFAKILDPNSVVREGEYKTVQDYSTALLQRFGINIARAFDARGFLTADARQAMQTTLNNILAAKQGAYGNLQSQYQRQIDDAYAGKNRTITDYTGAGSSSSGGSTGSGSIYDF